MSEDRIQEVTIVGGGTAGWLTAAILSSTFNRQGRSDPVKVVLVESPTVPTVGVGEGTLPSMAGLLHRIGVDENAFLRECNGSFKFGVRFEGWNLDEHGQPYPFLHGFTAFPPEIGGIPSLDFFLAFGAHPGRNRYDAFDNLSPGSEAVRLHLAPRPISASPYSRSPVTRYGYHLDAQRFAAFLRDFSAARGVRHILDDVDEAILGEGGHITDLRLRRRGLHPVELVIDCTGFQGLLITKALGESFQPYDSHLLCDRAIPIQIPHREGEPLQVHTSATAMSAGWIWKVPLFTRIGTGYVYSSAFRSDDEALREICDHLSLDPEKVSARVIRMRVGRLRRAWVGNCIAIGLSGGFIEPLEATAIASIDFAAHTLLENFPAKPIAPPLVDRFNHRMGLLYDAVRNFISAHYYLANRPEPFWVAARSQSVLSDTLRENLELWRHRLPTESDLAPIMLFSLSSYMACLASKGFFRRHNLRPRVVPAETMWSRYGMLAERQRAEIRKLPSARQLLTSLRGEVSMEGAVKESNPGEIPRPIGISTGRLDEPGHDALRAV